MDRNQLVGITLITVMLMTYIQIFAPQPPVKQGNALTVQSAVAAPELAPVSRSTPPTLSPSNSYGIFSTATQGIEKEIILENELIQVTLSSRGGTVKKVVLKKFQDHQKQQLALLDAQSSKMGLAFSVNGSSVTTNDLFFETKEPEHQCAEGADAAQVVFTLALGANQYVRQKFTLAAKGYTLDYDWEVVGLDGILDPAPLKFVWHDYVKQTEKDIEACRKKTTINYYLADGKFKHLKEHADKVEAKSIQEPIQWVAVKQRFFTAGIVAQAPFVNGQLTTKPAKNRPNTVKEAQVSLTLPASHSAEKPQGKLTFYFGPNDYQILSKVTQGFHRNMSLGWSMARGVNRLLIIPIFTFLEHYTSNYGVLIILLVIIIKILLLPLSYRSYVSMAKMKALKPALDSIKARHEGDLQKIQMEQINLYREVGINPLSSMVPILLQMPIFLAMFPLFSNFILFRQASFLWASDLSTYDAILQLPFSIPIYGSHVSLFALLMTASTMLGTWSNNQMSATQEGPMQALTYIMPFTFLLVLNSFPAGLSFYYFISNLTTFGEKNLIKRFVDEDKIKQKLEENKQKHRDRNKSRLQAQLGAAMKAENNTKKKIKNTSKNK